MASFVCGKSSWHNESVPWQNAQKESGGTGHLVVPSAQVKICATHFGGRLGQVVARNPMAASTPSLGNSLGLPSAHSTCEARC